MEAEALLLGIWKNIEDLEECLSLPELNAILGAVRDREYRQNKFTAALKGVDLDKHSAEQNQERLEAIERRVQARLSGVSEEKLELNELGFDFEFEEEE